MVWRASKTLCIKDNDNGAIGKLYIILFSFDFGMTCRAIQTCEPSQESFPTHMNEDNGHGA